MHGDVVAAVTAVLALPVVFAATAHVAPVRRVAGMRPDDSAGDVAGFGSPGHMVAELEGMAHGRPRYRHGDGHCNRSRVRAPCARYRIGTSPAPNAVSIRTSSHLGPTSTSGKSPTGT